MTVTSHELIDRARSWLGVPWHHQGRSRHGVDCIGFVVALLAELDAMPPGVRVPMDYGPRPNAGLVAGLERWCTRSPSCMPGVVLAIQWPRATVPSHIAIYTGDTIIHAYSRQHGVVEHGYRTPWPERTRGAWRLPGIDYSAVTV